MPVDRECLVEVNLTRCHLNIVAPGPPRWPGSRLYGLGGVVDQQNRFGYHPNGKIDVKTIVDL